ncbi:hypothetical protein KUCAC02_012843, partial [Chaenocephalus aceratus]
CQTGIPAYGPPPLTAPLWDYRDRTCCSGVPDGRREGPGLHWSLALEPTGAPTSTGHIPQHSSPAQPPTTLQPILNGITKTTQPEQKHVTNEYDNKQHSSRCSGPGNGRLPMRSSSLVLLLLIGVQAVQTMGGGLARCAEAANHK